MKKNDFSMIELLVVIAIISILASMLLPALKNAREQAKAIQCTSILKQRAVSGELYSSDYNVILPFSQINIRAFWHHSMLEYSNMNQSTFRKEGLTCPGDVAPNTNYTDTPSFNLSYLYNDFLGSKQVGWTQYDFIKIGTIRNPSKCGQMIDGHFDSSTSVSRGMPWQIVSGLRTYKVEYRHNIRANALFLDSHTERLSYQEIYWTLSGNVLGKGQ